MYTRINYAHNVYTQTFISAFTHTNFTLYEKVSAFWLQIITTVIIVRADFNGYKKTHIHTHDTSLRMEDPFSK